MKTEQIRAEELRIGNFANRHFENGEGQLTQCTVRDIFDCKRSHLESDFKFHYTAIPLSSEWLERFGFRKSVEHTWSFGYDKEYDVYRKGPFTYNGIQAQWWYHGVLEHQPEYVHQLQNLYFALTGTDLSLSPPLKIK